ncbi:hypothetical protein [Dactylosporangium sp. CA-139066]|uniref:hypothetical protein n=1 Tax=Dactylosporangium sp. CA-139066 TaxID=3239930 RepID=UPI003D92C9C6
MSRADYHAAIDDGDFDRAAALRDAALEAELADLLRRADRSPADDARRVALEARRGSRVVAVVRQQEAS